MRAWSYVAIPPKMRGLIVFNESSGVSFYSVDEEFQQFLQHRLKETGAGPDEPTETDNDLREALALFFLPVLASFEVLSSLKKPLLSITGEDDFTMVFKKHFNYVLVAVNGDGTETEEDLMRKLHVFCRIVCFLYGPVLNRMSPPNIQMKAIEWRRLNSLLKSYDILYSTEQSFLLEAVEHIRFGQLNTAQYACVSLAEECLNSNQNGGIPNMRHALLIVGSKILASCGRSPQLPTADTLLLILLTTNLYCHNILSDLITDESKKSSNPSTDVNGEFYPEDTDHDAQFSTPYQTPTSVSPSDTVTGKTEDCLHSPMQDNDKDDHQSFKTPYSFDDDGDDMVNKSFKGRIRNMLGGFGKNRASGDKFAGEYSLPADLFFKNGGEVEARFHEQKVFLQLNPNQYIPHKVHCLEVYPQIILVLISEPSSSNLAGVICQTLANLRHTLSSNISKSSLVSGRSLYDIIEDSVKRIIDGAKSEAKSLNSESLKKSVVKVFNASNRLKDANFLKYLEKNMTEQMELTHVVNNIENLIDSLIGLFDELYFSPKVCEYDKQSVVSRLQRLSLKLARDYGEYLCMKAMINLPFPGFDSAYPGMVHFSFVDRSFDELTTPSIIEDIANAKYLENLVKKTGDSSPSVLLKRKVWQMVKRSQRYLLHGYTSQTWMDDDFVYTYCLWVCMVNTNPGTSFRLTTPSAIRTREDEPPGVLCGTFYKDMMGGVEGNTPGYINELYCIHEPNISIEVATAHCKNLAVQLWSNTKQALAPFPLIN